MSKHTLTKLYKVNLPSEAYVIGLINKENNFWKTYTVKNENLEKAFPFNSHKSKYEYHIKPLEKTDAHYYTFLDDLKKENIDKMKLDGLVPAIVVETSPNNYQAWIRFENPMTYQQALATSRYLTYKYEADKGAISTSHFSRCPEFKRVLKDGTIFTPKLIESSQTINKNLDDNLIQAANEKTSQEAIHNYIEKNYNPAPHIKSPLMADLDNRCRTYISNLKNKGYSDQSRIDFIVMAWLYRDGYTRNGIISTMLENSENILKRKGNMHNAQRYLGYTFDKIEKEISFFQSEQESGYISPR